MGNKQVIFSDEQFDVYQDCTFFTRKDILRVFKRYRELNSDLVPNDMTDDSAQLIKLPPELIQKMPEFKENPFRRRILEVFSEDGRGNLTFDEFLDMFSLFSESAPLDLKAAYAFRLYDFDKDSFLGKEDLTKTICCLTRNELSTEEVDFVCQKIFEEADLDDDGKLCYSEFEHVIFRAPDFLRCERGNETAVEVDQ